MRGCCETGWVVWVGVERGDGEKPSLLHFVALLPFFPKRGHR